MRRYDFANELFENSKWNNQRCSNFIYELGKQNESSRADNLAGYIKEKKLRKEDSELLKTSEKVVNIAEQTWLVGTTLRF